MKKNFALKLCLLLAIFLLFPTTSMATDYPTKVGEKLGTGIANVVTGVAEVPKTMIITGRKEGATYGMTAGFFIGIIHMAGRLFTGALDIATFPVPTTPIPNPPFIWDDFNRETSYNTWRMR
ncbi:MAG: exosortase system-associated protein, TIGR04073 family [Nitrosomonas sp.]|nr:exosortase system-associated protein, TIGR04073 family [Nitrosomonas sp.]